MNCQLHNSVQLSDVIEIKHGFAFQSEFFGSSGDCLLLTPGTFAESGGFRDLGDMQKRYSGPVPSSFILDQGDVLVAMTEQSPGLLGATIKVPKSNTYLHNQRLGLITITRPDWITKRYVYHLFNAPHIRKDISAAASGTKVKHTSPAKLCALNVSLPPLDAQEEAASLLDTWDVAIEKPERLIAAKERLQLGLMQRLLRNKAFSPHQLSGLVDRITRKNVTGNDHPLTISGRNGLISQSHFFDKRIAAETTEHYTLLKRGEFAYNKSYSTGYRYGAIKRLDAYDDGIVSSLYLCFALKPNAPLLSDYLIYFCEAGGFNHQIHRIAQEGARNHGLLNVAADDFFAMKLPLPPIEHQRRVVEILGSASRELALLQESLDGLRDQKRGLMQKLLTGQWRANVIKGVSDA